MLVITDRTLRDAGLSFDEAVAMLRPDPSDLVVHIRQYLEAPVIEPPMLPAPRQMLMLPAPDGGGSLRRDAK